MTKDEAVNLTRIMREEGIQSIEKMPRHLGGDFHVKLTCGGYAGIGPTVEDAVEKAFEANKDYLHLLVKESV